MESLKNVCERLGLNSSNGLYYAKDIKWKTELRLPSRISRLLENDIKPDAFFCIDEKPIILFFENPTEYADLHKKIWNFNESPIVIILKKGIVEIFNGFKYDKELKSLSKIGNEKLNDFTYFNLFTDKTWETYQKDFEYKNRIDYYLLKNIKVARNKLNEKVKAKVANALIGKCIFVRYLIDRKVFLKFKGKRELWTNDKFCKLLENPKETKNFFDYLKIAFNGDDIFALADNDYKNISKDVLNILIKLLKGDNLEQDEQSLFDLYNFSIIPIEFISNVYELFIGAVGQENNGAYYTPLFLVDYILKETIDEHFKSNTKTSTCITLDPACGSGIFLVETLRRIIEQYQKNNNDRKLTPAILKDIAQKNIYGIDKDSNAIQVAIFSIYLTLLDYQEPANIETFKFPKLKDSNFFESDFFDTNSSFEVELKNIEFDYIVGNPPWGGENLGKYGELYIKERKKKDKAENKKYCVATNNKEIAEGFILRISDFSKSNTKCTLIIKSNILYNRGYNQNYSAFRSYWLEEFFVNKIVEFAPVRREIFNNAVAPAAILFYKYAHKENTDKNIVEHISIKPTRFFSYFKIFTINRYDNKEVEQKLLKDNDWLFKVLIYGSYLDFNLISRLKNYPTIKKIISNEKKFIYGTGIHCRKEPLDNPKSSEHLKGYKFIEPTAVEPYFIDYKKTDLLEPNKIDIVKDKRIYKAPLLLIRKGLDMESLNAKCAISTKNVIFKDSITSLKSLSGKTDILKIVLGLLSSDIYPYLAINTFSSIGIEREATKIYDNFSIPYIKCNIVKLVETIENAKIELYKQRHQKVMVNDSEIQDKISETQNIINKTILDALNFDDIEKSLLDYALTINRPLITRNQNNEYDILEEIQKPLLIRSKEIIDYANIYIERFKRNLNSDTEKFIVRIWHTNQLLGMFFEVVPINTPEENGIVWGELNNEDILKLIIKFSSEKITDRLYIQKDIRGFEKKYFYIFKPNEKRLWHKAMAYLDVEEFMDAILSAGSKGK